MNKQKRNLYLSNMAVEEALALFLENTKESVSERKTERVAVTESLGRITAKAVYAKVSSPNYNASAMDGIAVKARTTFSAADTNPVRLTKNTDYIFVDTGDPIEPPFDAVIMIEDIVEIDENTVEIIKAAAPWQDIRPIGEDIVAHEMIISDNHIIQPFDIAALLSGGISDIRVSAKPKIAIIPTGTEIIELGEAQTIGKIIESNSWMLSAMATECGGIPNRYKPVADDYSLLKNTIEKAAQENDIVVINAGSSAGSEDFTANIIRELGQVFVHGIATKPGKPAILGQINGKPVVGTPGYPSAAYFVFDTFVKPLISRYLSFEIIKKDRIKAVSSRRIISSLKHTEFIRVKVGNVDGKLIATPLNRGSGATMSLVRADGVMIIPRNSEGVEAGEEADVEIFKSLEEINNTLVSIGSHDLAMDIIGSIMQRENNKYRLSSAHVGSLGGVMALRRREAHIAPIHLLDEDDGTYNISYIKKYINNTPMALIKGVNRVQGFMIKKNNPKKIYDFGDLVREDITFVNRQKGAGTRLLVDYKLKEANIDITKINGYEWESTTHMSVAAAVSSGAADVGVGAYSAAQAMELDFIAIGDEEYDFAVALADLDKEMVQLFIQVLKSKEFKDTLEKMGGYSFSKTGEIITID